MRDTAHIRHGRRALRRAAGFTLIELMIVVAVVAILAALAYPPYDEFMRRARRADAQAALLELAQFMERYYTTNGRYSGAALPFAESPRDGATKYYDLGFSVNPGAGAYTLQASPKGTMAGDDCGSLRLAHTGARSHTGTASAAQCWRN